MICGMRLGVLAAGIALAMSAQAQSSVETPDEASKSTEQKVTLLDGIEVTAEAPVEEVSSGVLGKRSELDTPFSISTVTSEEIEAYQAKSLVDVFARDASVSRSAGSDYNGWASRLIVRGLPIDFYDAIKINSMPASFLFGVNLPLEVMEQVQLLKGASGFMYGFSAPGGIVNYVTKKPTDDTRASFDVGYRSDQVYSEHADLGGRFGADQRFGYRFNVSHDEGDTYTNSSINRTAGALSLDARLTPDLTWTADLLYQHNKVKRPPPYYTINTSTYTSDKLPAAISGDNNAASDQSSNETWFQYASTGLAWQISPDWKFDFNLSKAKNEFRLSQEYFYLVNEQGDYRDATFDGFDVYSSEYAQAMLEGKFRTGPIDHQIVTGLSWQRLIAEHGYTNYIPGTVYRESSNIYSPVPIVWDPYDGNPSTYKVSDTRQKAVFLSDTLTFSPQWSLLAGLRYTDYHQVYAASYTLTSSGDLDITNATYSKSVVTPTVALMYKPVPDATVYASYVESLEQGTTVGSTYANYGETLDPQMSEQYELGFKWERPAWGASAALFRIDRGAGYANSDNYYVQDGLQRYDGLELAGDLRPTPDLTLGATAVYLDASYKKTANAWLIDRRVEGTARFMATLQASYEVPSVPGLSVHADGKYWGPTAVYNISAARVTVMAAGYAVFNAGANYRTQIGGHPVTFRGELQNLFNREYWQGGYYNFSLGAPRALSLNVQFDF